MPNVRPSLPVRIQPALQFMQCVAVNPVCLLIASLRRSRRSTPESGRRGRSRPRRRCAGHTPAATMPAATIESGGRPRRFRCHGRRAVRAPWPAFLMFWIAGDDPSSDCMRDISRAAAPASPIRQRASPRFAGADGVLPWSLPCRVRAPQDMTGAHALVDVFMLHRSPSPDRETCNAVLVPADQHPSPSFKFRVQHVLPARVPRRQDGTRLPEPRRNRLPVVRPVVLSMHAESGRINSGDRVFGHAP
jgi:hypothetical protein